MLGTLHEAREIALSARLGLGTPTALVEGVVVLEFPAESQQAKEVVDGPAARAAIETIMARLFTNAPTYRTVFAAPRVSEARPEPYDPDKPYYTSVAPAAAKAVLQDPGVAAVLDVFKGRIAEIRHPEPPVETP